MDCQYKDTNTFLDKYTHYLPIDSLDYIYQKLSKAQCVVNLNDITFSHPNVALLLSIFLGCIGFDRFYIKSYAIGICKLLTGGGCGIWWLLDIFLIKNAAKQKNLFIILDYIKDTKNKSNGPLPS